MLVILYFMMSVIVGVGNCALLYLGCLSQQLATSECTWPGMVGVMRLQKIQLEVELWTHPVSHLESLTVFTLVASTKMVHDFHRQAVYFYGAHSR
jgi:hypothetical protein